MKKDIFWFCDPFRYIYGDSLPKCEPKQMMKHSLLEFCEQIEMGKYQYHESIITLFVTDEQTLDLEKKNIHKKW